MTENDFNSGKVSQEQGEPLSATGMFLRAFESGAEPDPEPTAPAPTKSAATAAGPGVSAVPSSGSGPSKPGEFTRIFQAAEAKATTSSASPVSQPPVSPLPKKESPASAAAPAPGEFTRIFVSASTPSASTPSKDQAAKPLSETSPAPSSPAAGAPRLKGFSTPGVSDSASAEGSFTQFFSATSSAPKPAPTPVQAYNPPAPAPFEPLPDRSRERDFGASFKPFEAAPPAASGSATGLMSSLASPGAPSVPRTPELLPSLFGPNLFRLIRRRRPLQNLQERIRAASPG